MIVIGNKVIVFYCFIVLFFCILLVIKICEIYVCVCNNEERYLWYKILFNVRLTFV